MRFRHFLFLRFSLLTFHFLLFTSYFLLFTFPSPVLPQKREGLSALNGWRKEVE